LDGDGMVDYHEFMTAAVDYNKLMTSENLKMAFDLFDINGDGKINISEFK
jgi:calcium-dependent protein kinase